jgi:hypothetical protein
VCRMRCARGPPGGHSTTEVPIMTSATMDAKTWAREQFGQCDLGDRRRTKRAVYMAQRIAENPSGSFPDIFERWEDVKAAYALFAAKGVSFAALARPHWEQTRACAPACYLVIGDTTEVDFGIRREISGLGPTGNGTGRGFLLHSALLVGAESEEIVGLAGQVIHYRKPAPKGENASERLARERESRIWGDVIDQVGRPPSGVRWIHTLDRGADNFEVFCHLVAQSCDWVVRATQRQRNVFTAAGDKKPLAAYLDELPATGTFSLYLRARPKQRARRATIEVHSGQLSMPVPFHKSGYVKEHQREPISMWVVWAREINAPDGVEALDWVLYTSLPVEGFAEACRIIGYYEKRWLIEEWHKALKTGCREEHRQLKSAVRLEAMTGLLSVVAVRLVQLKAVARTDPARPAGSVVPLRWIRMLARVRRLHNAADITVRQFYRELAKLGGFLGRRHDGEPGWITIWRGWEKLHLMLRGAELASVEGAT